MSFPLVRDLAAGGVSVRLFCGILGRCWQAYYAWVVKPVSERDLEDAYLTDALIEPRGGAQKFGYGFLGGELERAGHVVGEGRVWRLCSQQKFW